VTAGAFPPIDVASEWPKLNEQLVELVDTVPSDKWNWSPRDGLWNFKGIFLHIPMARYNWLINQVKDGGAAYDMGEFLRSGQTPDGIKQHLRESWERLLRFMSASGALDGTYDVVYYETLQPVTGHWIAYHLLEHDIHHRAEIFGYMALLGVAHPNVETP
jgi:uncharacterized damage-inducible protein DinB